MVEEEERRIGLTGEIKKLTNLVEDRYKKEKNKTKEKRKRLLLPRKIRAGSNKKLKKNYLIVFKISTNGYIKPLFLPIANDMVYLEETDTFHETTADYVMRYGKYPAIILPEWSLLPFSKKDHAEKTKEKGEEAINQRVLIKAMELSQLKLTKKLSGKSLLIWVVISVVILYLLSQMVGGGV